MTTISNSASKFCCFVLICVIGAGCASAPDFGDIPQIYYNGVTQSTELDASGKKIRENITITISFEDGDGNLGASVEERGDPAFQKRYGNWGNYELVTSTKSATGVWSERILSGDSVKWIPLLKSEKIRGPIKGNLDLNFNRPYGNTTVPVDVKFKVRIRDRDLNVSNQIETDVINVPGYR